MDNQQEAPTVFPPAASWMEWLSNTMRGLWRQIVFRPSPASATHTVVAHPPVAHAAAQLIMEVTVPDEQGDVLCVALIGAVNHHTYEGLLETVKAHYQQGNRRLVLDLRRTTELKLSGLFALINIARLYHGQPLLDPAEGWLVLGQAAEECTPELAQRVKLLAPSRAAGVALRSVRYGDFFECHADLSSALTALCEE